MKRILLLVLIITSIGFGQKKVLIEMFTNSHCSVCVNGYSTLNTFFQNTTNDNRYVEIFYHMSYPYSDDPLHHHNEADAKLRDQYYGPFFFTPIAFFDGAQQPGGSYSSWGTQLESKLSVNQKIDIVLTGSKTDDDMNITAEVTNLTQDEISNLKINFMIVEDVAYQGRNGISQHDNVMRKIVDAAGSDFTLGASGNRSFSISSDYNGEWVKNNLSVVVFVQGSDKSVYQVEEIEYSELGTTGVDDNTVPTEFRLNQNYPNPFNPSTNISYSLPDESFVKLSVFDILGNKVAEPVSETQPAGDYQVKFDAANISSGIYFYTLSAGENKITKKMILLR